jgi:hypothetical protein
MELSVLALYFSLSLPKDVIYEKSKEYHIKDEDLAIHKRRFR